MYDENTIYFAPTKDLATLPVKQPGKFGFQLFSIFTDKELRIESTERVKIKLGFRTFFDTKWGFLLKEEKELANNGIIILGGFVDSDYVDEWELVLYNSNKEQAFIIDKKVDEITVCEDAIRYPYLIPLCRAILYSDDLPNYEMTYQEQLYTFRKAFNSQK